MITSHRLLQSHLRLVRLAAWGLALLAVLLTVEVSREIRRLAAEWQQSQPVPRFDPQFLAGQRKKVAEP